MSDKLLEEDIISHWIYKDETYISCICTTFNQESYISDAIDGFLSQETSYSFEILIHDDASTDKTKDILLDYQSKYPSIIKLILQEENQYSKGVHVLNKTVEKAAGKYVALCEGDDFWIDKHKLQKQIVELEKNKDINLVISKATSLYPDTTTSDFCDLGNEKKIIPFEECILGPKKDFFPTASFFLRKKVFEQLPDWFYTDAPVGDYYIQLFAANKNGCIYLPNITTVYRRDAKGSYNLRLDNEKRISSDKKRIYCGMLMLNDHAFSTEYKRFIRKHIFKFKISLFKLYLEERKFSELVKIFVSVFFKDLDLVLEKIYER